MMTSWDQLEQAMFDKYAQGVDLADVPVVFILGSPRTGSTLLYQLLINLFPFTYFNNTTNDLFSEHPGLGLLLHQQLVSESTVSYDGKLGCGLGKPTSTDSHRLPHRGKTDLDQATGR